MATAPPQQCGPRAAILCPLQGLGGPHPSDVRGLLACDMVVLRQSPVDRGGNRTARAARERGLADSSV